MHEKSLQIVHKKHNAVGLRRHETVAFLRYHIENKRWLGTDVAGIASRRRAGRVGGSDVDADHAADDGVIVSIARTLASTARWRRLALSNGAGRCRRRAVATGTPPRRPPRVRPGYAPRRTHGMLAHFMVRLYIAVVCKITYGSFIPQSTCGSYRIVVPSLVV